MAPLRHSGSTGGYSPHVIEKTSNDVACVTPRRDPVGRDAPSSISALPAIVRAVDSTMEVHFDGGVRSGQDVLRALALGADSAWIGRAYMYGLGAQGEAGVSRCLDILHNELMSTMALCGLTRVTDASPDLLINP